jgi:hypothetical protein
VPVRRHERGYGGDQAPPTAPAKAEPQVTARGFDIAVVRWMRGKPYSGRQSLLQSSGLSGGDGCQSRLADQEPVASIGQGARAGEERRSLA